MHSNIRQTDDRQTDKQTDRQTTDTKFLLQFLSPRGPKRAEKSFSSIGRKIIFESFGTPDMYKPGFPCGKTNKYDWNFVRPQSFHIIRYGADY